MLKTFGYSDPPIIVTFLVVFKGDALICNHLSTVNVTTVRMEAQVTDSVKTVLKSHMASPKRHGYWCHIEYTSRGIAATDSSVS